MDKINYYKLTNDELKERETLLDIKSRKYKPLTSKEYERLQTLGNKMLNYYKSIYSQIEQL